MCLRLRAAERHRLCPAVPAATSDAKATLKSTRGAITVALVCVSQFTNTRGVRFDTSTLAILSIRARRFKGLVRARSCRLVRSDHEWPGGRQRLLKEVDMHASSPTSPAHIKLHAISIRCRTSPRKRVLRESPVGLPFTGVGEGRAAYRAAAIVATHRSHPRAAAADDHHAP
jgi:hypothetical protein